MAGLLLINPRAGNAAFSPEELAGEARARGIGAHVLEPRGRAREVARTANADALGIAGGDGSLAPVADIALARDLPFVCVPFGTRNHFARDLGLRVDDPVGALSCFEGVERRVDVGRANGRLFLNNVSLGLYARLVHRRERHRLRREAFARLRAWAIVVTHREPLGITIDGRAIETYLVLVANNAYDTNLPTIGRRERLDEGLLHLYAAGVEPGERVAEHFVVDAKAGRLEAAIDGQPDVLRTPLDFRIEPGVLRVLVPARERS